MRAIPRLAWPSEAATSRGPSLWVSGAQTTCRFGQKTALESGKPGICNCPDAPSSKGGSAMPDLSPRRPSRRASRDLDWPVGSRISYVLWRRNYTGGVSARARSFWHHVLCAYDSETCGKCGRRVEAAWLADNDLWTEIVGHDGGILCIRCFDRELADRGRFVQWVPRCGAGGAEPIRPRRQPERLN